MAVIIIQLQRKAELHARIAANPERYTYWFRHYMRQYADAMFSGRAA